MPDYKKLYLKLFSACCDVLEVLQQITLEAEQMALDAADTPALSSNEKNEGGE